MRGQTARVMLVIPFIIGITLLSSFMEEKSLHNLPPSVPSIEEPVAANTKAEEDKISGILPELEQILEDKEQVDGYTVEVYREYEVYRNKNGDVLKSVPTENLSFLRYKE
ncbi:hypothetical protein [Peribacillus sp. SCS-155]|uniref:hypothetical protein n=1 Tax=Peribacillus sedimenti TaxID=3115297 RepID=UPI003905A87B